MALRAACSLEASIEIGNGLGLGQIELVVEEGALAELAGTGRADALDLQNAADQHVQDDGAAVALQLQHILAGEAVGGLEQQGYALIQRLALLVPEGQIFGITHPGSLPSTISATRSAAGPETRTMPTPPRPGAVAWATMVSVVILLGSFVR